MEEYMIGVDENISSNDVREFKHKESILKPR